MLKGIFPPIPTPFIDDEIAFDKLKFNLDKWNKTGLRGYVVCGSNGESAFLTNDEKIKLVSKIKENVESNKTIIAGTGSDSIKETISLTNKAAEEGADYALVLTPSYYKSAMNHNVFMSYFFAIAESTKIPIIIYNVPKFTGISIEPNTVAQLAQHDNIIGIKETSTDIAHLQDIIINTPNDFFVMVGTASILYPSLCIGAMGAILAVSNVAPNLCVNLYNSFLEGRLSESLEIQRKLIPINKAVTSQYGIPGLKAALDLLGYFGGQCRKPLSALTEPQLNELKNILIQVKLIN